MTAEIDVDTHSLDSAATALRDAAEDLRIGQFDLFLVESASPPFCPGEVAKALRDFAGYAHSQYRDTTSLMATLAARITAAAEAYRQKDAAMAYKVGAVTASAIGIASG